MSLILLGILNSQAAGAGAAGAYDLLETQILTGSAASVTFTGLGSYSDYKHLQIRGTVRTDRGGTLDQLWIQMNSDTGSNHSAHYLKGDGSSVASGAILNQAYMAHYYIACSGAAANNFSPLVMDVLDFSSASKNSTVRSLLGTVDSSNAISLVSGLWNSTNALTSIKFYAGAGGANLVTGSRFSLYGIKGA